MRVVNVDSLLKRHSNNTYLYNLLNELLKDEEILEVDDKKFNSKDVRTTFKKLGIPVGAILTYKDDDEITCRVADDNNKIIYKGKTYTLSHLVRELKMSPTNVYNSYNGFKFFTYRGRFLTDIRASVENS